MSLFALLLLIAPVMQDTGRVAGWRSDLDFLAGEARRLHAGPARPAHAPAFEAAIRDLKARVPSLGDGRMFVEIQRLMAMLGDGHSLVYPVPTGRTPLPMLGIDLYWLSDGLYVVGGRRGMSELTGSRVDSIGSIASEVLLRRLEPYVSRDNAMAVKAFATHYLISAAFLEALGAFEPSAGFVRLSIREPGGARRTVAIRPGTARRPPRKLLPPAGTAAPVPLYLERVDTPYWMRRLRGANALYFQFNQVSDAEDEPLSSFAARLRDSLTSSRASSVVVDVRHNNGGNNMLLGPLLEVLAGFQRSAAGNRIYVLTSRVTFSAAQNFINRLERTARPVFVGEPSMSSPNFTGEDHEVVLPWSGLRVSISNRYWQDSHPDDPRPWIAPHIPVELSSRDYFANRDPVLAATLEAIAGRRTRR